MKTAPPDPKFVTFEEWVRENPGILDDFPEEDCLGCAGEGGVECGECGHQTECEECEGYGFLGGIASAKQEYNRLLKLDKERWEKYLQEKSLSRN